MTKITEKQLIEQLKTLKDIKPRKEWAVLLKSQILAQQTAEPIRAQFSFVDFISNFKFQISNSRRLAYSFAVVLFLIVGVFGFNKLMPVGEVPQQTVALTNQTAAVIKDQINVTVKNLSQNLKNNPVQDSQTMKILAKTLADMPGDVASSQDVKDLVQIVVSSEIADLQKTTLTNEQKITLAEAEELYNQGKYTDALEKILLINI